MIKEFKVGDKVTPTRLCYQYSWWTEGKTYTISRTVRNTDFHISDDDGEDMVFSYDFEGWKYAKVSI